MKRVIPIILVLVMAFAFSITALADGEEEDIVVLPPVDPGEKIDDIYTNDNLDLVLDPTPSDPNIESGIYGIDTEDWDEDYWNGYNDHLLFIVDEYKSSAAYDKDIVFDAIQYIAETFVIDSTIVGPDNGVTGLSGWITVSNYNLGYDTIKAILQLFEGVDYILITEFEYDAATGTLKFFVEDLGVWSVFFALIERGVAPATAARVASGRSPQTSDNSIYVVIILLITLSAAVTTIAISKKARNHN